MAKMIPTNLDLSNPTDSERKVFNALKSQLRPDVHVFYSVSWQTTDILGKRKQSECDFLIIDPKYGFLTCEVKGGYRLEVTANREWRVWDSEHEFHGLTRSPQEQAEENARYFKQLYEDINKMNYEGVYGAFTIFPNYIVDDVQLRDNRPGTIVLDKSNMNSLSDCIDNVFKYYKGKKKVFFTNDQRSKFMDLINNRKAISAAAGDLIENKEKEFETINRVQDGYIYFMKEHNQVLIAGGAGTGKTWIGMKLAINAYKDNKKVLFVCYSPKLSEYIKCELHNSFGNDSVSVLSYEELIKIDKKNLEYLKYPYKLIDEYNDNNFMHYDTIIVDEAQDFDKYEAMIIRLHLEDDDKSDLYVFYDKTQNLYHKDFADGFMIKENTFHLRENLRNTASIYNFACDKTSLGSEVIANQIIGSRPERKCFNSIFELNEYLENVLNILIDREFVPSKYITVLVSNELYPTYFDMKISKWTFNNENTNVSNIIKLVKTEDFKGMESNVVFYIHDSHSTKEFDYVAYTRAKYFLYDFIIKN